jgi:hypothetical protein
MTPEDRTEFLTVFPQYEWKEDEYGQRRRTTDAELEFLRNLEDTAELERLELDYPILGAIIEGFSLRRPNMGEDERLSCAAWLRFAFVTDKYYGHREG